MGSCAKRSWPARGVSPEAQASRRSRRAVLLASCGGHRRDEPSIRTAEKKRAVIEQLGKRAARLIKSRQASCDQRGAAAQAGKGGERSEVYPCRATAGDELGIMKSWIGAGFVPASSLRGSGTKRAIAKWKLD